MQLTRVQKIIISAIAVIILLGIYIVINKQLKKSNIQETNNNPLSTTTVATGTTKGNSSGVSNVEATGGYTVEPVYGNEGVGVPQPVPDLRRKVEIYPGAIVTPEATKAATEKILTLQEALRNNTADLRSWINLGIYQKMAGDYNGAVLSWKYAGRLSPTDYVSLSDLGNIYAYFIKDNVKAETYYKSAIKLGPNQANLYIQLAEVYKDLFNDLNKSKAIIDEGLKILPNDANLLSWKARFN